jgi:hypothetical protein
MPHSRVVATLMLILAVGCQRTESSATRPPPTPASSPLDSLVLDSGESMGPDSVARAEHRLRMLAYLMWKRSQALGAFPPALVDVLPNDTTWRSGQEVLDLWGMPIRYSAGRDSAVVESAGADRQRGTRDDIRIVTTRDTVFSVGRLR